ncbi:MAG: Type IV pilus biogenesis and competence protein PilQ [Halieaceae bacterium]|nr:MAG: Type IV pilus biogenesis and competence protein PilQ [Halieaceae bacterium]
MMRANPNKRIGAVPGGWISLLVGCFWSVAAAATPGVIEDIAFTAQPGAQLEVRLTFSQPPSANIESYTIEEPARIVLDFPDTRSGLEQKRFSLSQANATSVMVLESDDRTRMIINLVDLVPFESSVSGRQLTLMIGQDGGQAAASSAAADILRNDANRVERVVSEITDLAFQRSPEGEGLLILTLTNPSVDASIFSEGGDITLQFLNTNIREALIRHFDVTDFATPVRGIEVSTTEHGTKLKLRADGFYDYLAYQTGDEYILAVAALNEEEKRERLNEFDYVGDRISLNFQSIEVRAVLQLIADFTELNLVASDSVTGSITLRLQNVPWDQALDLVLKTRGLDSRQIGNVLMVAPAQEIAERERQEIEANKQLAELAPLQSEFIRIRYATAIDVVGLFEAGSEEGGALISERGSVVVDERTNSIVVTDTAAKLAEIRDLIEKVDIPIRQVMIEARIVIASSNIDEQLGIRWGGGYLNVSGDKFTSIAGDTASATNLNSQLIGGDQVDMPSAPFVDLGVAEATSGFAVGFTSTDLFLTAELSALEASGEGEVVSQPKVITGDKQKASIKSGTEIPYQEGAASGATTTAFKEAVLKLDVTPNITPDDRILLDLVVNQDSVGDLVPSGNGGLIPTIDTTELMTQVLVGNGETVVLGGVFKNEELVKVEKVPLLGDIPYLGNLFKSTANSQQKTETLIFITPRILSEALVN